MNNLKKLQADTKTLSVLYVEDNEALRNNAAKLLKKFFSHVSLAADGKEGLALFKKRRYPIVLTDIKMPKMDGLELAHHIHEIAPETKVIIMSAFDDRERLLKGIELGIFRFLKKPANVTELAEVLHVAAQQIKHELHTKMFQMHLKDIFQNQSSLVMLLDDKKILLANDAFLDFFGFESLNACKKEMPKIDNEFLPHSGFLYNDDQVDALELLKKNPQKLYNVKMKNHKGEISHFILKYQSVPEKENYGVLSLDDVTQMNLLELFDAKQNAQDISLASQESLFDFLDVIKRNNAKVELHNYYKGLSITNDGVITDVSESEITIKTTYMQQKALQIAQKVLIVSSALPHTIEARVVEKINFEKQEVVLSSLQFVKTSPITRKTIRVTVEGKQSVSLFLGEGKFHGDIEIEDISLDAVKLKMNALPAGLDKDSDITLDIVLELDGKPLIINTKATLLRKQEFKHSFSVVFIFGKFKKSDLVKYITKRQMTLIREIKGIQNG